MTGDFDLLIEVNSKEEKKSKIKVSAFAVSLDGFGAGPNQSSENPLGISGTELHNWFFKTKVFQKMHGGGDGVQDIDNTFAERSFENIGA